jgi:Na+/proline symporter
MSPKNATVARWSSILAGILYVGFGLIPVLIGIFGRLAMPEATGESILIDLSLKFLSPPLIALMVGALLSAIMSSADSALLAPASIIGHNIVPYLKPGASEGLQLKWCKWGVPLIGILSLFLALYFKNIYVLCQESWGVLLTGVAAPMIAGVYWKKANRYGAFAGALAGSAAWILLRIFLPGNYPHNLFGFLISGIFLVIVSLLT